MKHFLDTFFPNLKKIFWWPNVLWHLLAIFLTYVILMTGLDWYYFSATRFIPKAWWMPAGIVGFLLPLLLPFMLYIAGRIRNSMKVRMIAFAVGQAVVLSYFISSAYKAFTGRIPPNFADISTNISHGFQFGFWEGGVFWGWPSSHAAVAFAMSVTLFILYPKNPKLKYLWLLYALYIGFGASIGFHWLSESVAGAIIGSVVGVVVGKSFKTKI